MSDFELSRLMLSLALLLSSALVLGQLFDSIRLPRVIGEICAGILLGPSVLGGLSPEAHHFIFHGFAEQEKLLSVFYWLGLILLMFSAGFKVSLNFEKGDHALVFKLILGGISLPFVFGFAASPLVANTLQPEPLAFSLVIAIAAAVTSIPVLTKIFLDLGIGSGRFARLILAAAAVQDLLLWTVLSVAIAVQNGQNPNGSAIVATILSTGIFTFLVILLVPPLLRSVGSAVIERSSIDVLFGYTLLVCLILIYFATLLEVNVVFSALLAGMAIGRFKSNNMERVRDSIVKVSVWFFVPLYFSLVGVRINLQAHLDVWLLATFLIASSAIKILSVALLTRAAVGGWLRAFDFGITMNARGGPGIVLASVAYTANIIDEKLFVALVLTSVLTSLFSGFWLRRRLDAGANEFV